MSVKTRVGNTARTVECGPKKIIQPKVIDLKKTLQYMSTFCCSVGTSSKKPAINLVFNVSRQDTNLFFFLPQKTNFVC